MNVLTQWIGVVGGALAWLAFLQINYALTPSACNSGDKTPLAIVTMIALLGTIAAALAAWRSWHHSGANGAIKEGGATRVSRFMAFSGMGLSAFFALVVLASAIPIIFLGACD
jgi:hypothetical protein